jgi:hypothetical protein
MHDAIYKREEDNNSLYSTQHLAKVAAAFEMRLNFIFKYVKDPSGTGFIRVPVRIESELERIRAVRLKSTVSESAAARH